MKPVIACAVVIAAAASATSAVAQSCIVRTGGGASCSESLQRCLAPSSGNPQACRAAHAGCMKTGRWISHSTGGQCFDWGTKDRK